MKLEYIGNGTQHITGIPARSLTLADIEQLVENGVFSKTQEALAVLSKSAIYKEVITPKKKKTESDGS